jgi:hypothetical protein
MRQWNEIERVLTKYMHKRKVFFAVFIKTPANPKPTDTSEIILACRKAIEARADASLKLPNGTTAELLLLANSPELISSELLAERLAKSGVSLHSNAFLMYPQMFELNFTIPTETDSGLMLCEYPRRLGPAGGIRYPIIYAFRSDALPTRAGSIENLVNDARNQFSKTRPALVYVNYEPLENPWREPLTAEELNKLALRCLNRTQTISEAVFARGPFAAASRASIILFRNPRARLPLPVEFSLQS